MPPMPSHASKVYGEDILSIIYLYRKLGDPDASAVIGSDNPDIWVGALPGSG